MFRYVLALLLLNTCSNSFVSPLPTTASNGPVSNWLAALAKHCENTFLSRQIISKIKDCNVPVSPFNEQLIGCLLFYDINTRLCDAVASAKLSLIDDYSAKISETFEVEKMCTIAKDFNVTSLPENPSYKANVEKVFVTPLACAKVCGVPDILNQDSNFFCKYFKWGSEMLTHQMSSAPTQVDIFVPHVSSETAPKIENNVQPSVNNILHPSAIASNTKSNNNPNEPLKESDSGKVTNEKPEQPVSNVDAEPRKPEVSAPSSTSKLVSGLENIEVSAQNPLGAEVKAPVAEAQPVDSLLNVNPSQEGMDKPSAAEVHPSDKDEVAKLEAPLKNMSVEQKEAIPVIEKSKPQSSPEDYPDSDDAPADLQGDDDDTVMNDPDVNPPKITPKKTEISAPEMVSDTFPNSLQDGYTNDDDQVFYPFFLTAVILVILLYVLYHNKNKVSKVFLGLIVEGRQSGRRRNSRGHAYRRLDTLEQAMSTNTAAPPSKIIY